MVCPHGQQVACLCLEDKRPTHVPRLSQQRPHLWAPPSSQGGFEEVTSVLSQPSGDWGPVREKSQCEWPDATTILVQKWWKANESATSLSNERLHHGAFLKFLSTFRKCAMPFSWASWSWNSYRKCQKCCGWGCPRICLFSKTIVDNCVKCPWANMLIRLCLSFLIGNMTGMCEKCLWEFLPV